MTDSMQITEQEAALAQPENPSAASIEAWYMDDDTSTDQRLEHKQSPNKPCSLETLQSLGVLYWSMDPSSYPEDPKLKAIRKVRGYSYEDTVDISPDTLPGYDEKIKAFYEEHIHTDEEIRYVLDGSGYFDVRDGNDQWIRISCKPGDLIVLPEGIYHRFTLDQGNYIKALRLFVGEPVWTPYNRTSEIDQHPSRIKYVNAH
mmetsp:Transcript_7245/g.14503  ORF Transcript_7245/g.14503 Transcript_7245/m.14503 type:complete len:202 (-) Transcript_7245:206-811(-)